MYSDVVMEKSEGIEPAENQGIRQQLDRILEAHKKAKGYEFDVQLTADDLKELCEKYKAKIREVLGVEFPDDTQEHGNDPKEPPLFPASL